MRAPVSPPRQSLKTLLDGFGATDVPGLAIADVAIDSREVGPDTLFLACPGTRAHGLDHAVQAIANGAVAIAWDAHAAPELSVPAVQVPQLAAHASEIAARLYGRPSEAMFVTGVTGTDGKTSCAWLLARALSALGRACGYLGTLGYGRVGALETGRHTTPDAVHLQAWLARLLQAHVDAVAFEVSSHALDQHRVDGVAFDVAVLTQIGRDHLDYHGDTASYIRAKRRLFERPGLRFAVLNADDTSGRAWLSDLPARVTPVAYGTGALAGLAARYVSIAAVESRIDGLVIEVETHAGAARIESPLVGRFNAANLAAVLAVLLTQGIALDAAAAALAEVPTVPGRMERVPARDDQPLVIVDYAHTPNALEQALVALRPHAEGRLLCVFGCGGERDPGKRALMGAAAAHHADGVWVTDDNPRGESPDAIVAQILEGMGCTRPRVIHDRAAAIADAIGQALPGDVVLIAGKGHETTQQVGATARAFDDRVAARRALEAA